MCKVVHRISLEVLSGICLRWRRITIGTVRVSIEIRTGNTPRRCQRRDCLNNLVRSICQINSDVRPIHKNYELKIKLFPEHTFTQGWESLKILWRLKRNTLVWAQQVNIMSKKNTYWICVCGNYLEIFRFEERGLVLFLLVVLPRNMDFRTPSVISKGMKLLTGIRYSSRKFRGETDYPD
jgi:hypothetical protein